MIGFAFDQDDCSRIHPVLVDAQVIQHQVAQLIVIANAKMTPYGK